MKLATLRTLSALLIATCLTDDATCQPDRGRRSQGLTKLSNLVYRSGEMESNALDRTVNYSVFLPADYDAEENKATRYPTIFFLHGMWEDHRRFYSRGGAPVLDELVGDGTLPEVVFVCVNDFSRGSFYINGKRAKVEDMILKEMLPFIAKTYRCKKGREHRALLGVSMGGFGALKIAFKYPKIFGVVATHSAAILPEDHKRLLDVFPWAERYADRMIKPVFGAPVDQKLWAAENPLVLARTLEADKLQGLKVYFDCGDTDRYNFQEPNLELHKVLKDRKIPHTWRLVKGGNHGWNTRRTEKGYNQSELPHSLRFIAAAWTQKKALKGLSGLLGGKDGK